MRVIEMMKFSLWVIGEFECSNKVVKILWQLWRRGASVCHGKKHAGGGAKVSQSYSASRHMHTLRLCCNNFSLQHGECKCANWHRDTGDSTWTPQCCTAQGWCHSANQCSKITTTQRFFGILLMPYTWPHLQSQNLGSSESRLWMQMAQCVNILSSTHTVTVLWLAVSFKCLQVDFSQCTMFLLWARIHTNCAGRLWLWASYFVHKVPCA